MRRNVGQIVGAEPRGRLVESLPWVVCATSAAFTVLGAVFYLQNRTVPGAEQFFDPVMPAVALAFPLLGAFVASQRPRNAIGWICSGTAVVSVAWFAEQYAVYALVTRPHSLPGGVWMAWLGTWTWLPGYLALWTLLVLLFPDGRPPSSRWRPLVWTTAGVIGVTTVLTALAAEHPASPSRQGPLGIASLPDIAGLLQSAAVLVLGPLCLVALAARYRRAPAADRPPLRAVLVAGGVALLVPVAAALFGVLLGGPLPLGAYQAVGVVTVVGVAVAIAIAVVRHRLYDLNVEIDTLVNRTIVYGGLVLVGVGVYVAVVTLAEALVSGDVGLGPSLVAVAVVVLVWRQLRTPLQRGVDRLLYRKRDYDYRILTSLGQCVQSTVGPDAVLPAIVETIAAGLKLPHVAVTVGQDDTTLATARHGEPSPSSEVRPLVHQGELVGSLTVSPRTPEGTFDAADHRLLDDLAGPVSTTAYALCLTADLQRSRERLVTAREEERRRLRRELHDGLQPALAGIALGLEAVGNLVGDAATAGQLLARLQAELQAAGSDLRHIIYDLRPPALDELGLVGALRQQAIRFNLDPDGIEVVITAPPELRGLPAAVEVAAYRIGQEALENVRKHARARTCEVSVSLDDSHLQLEVHDDGEGVDPESTWGVGMVTMRERAAELGGSFGVEPEAGGGTRIRAILPVSAR